MPLAFKASVLACFRGTHDQLSPLTFKASRISTAPLGPCCISPGPRISTGSRMMMNPLDPSKHIMASHSKTTIVNRKLMSTWHFSKSLESDGAKAVAMVLVDSFVPPPRHLRFVTDGAHSESSATYHHCLYYSRLFRIHRVAFTSMPNFSHPFTTLQTWLASLTCSALVTGEISRFILMQCPIFKFEILL